MNKFKFLLLISLLFSLCIHADLGLLMSGGTTPLWRGQITLDLTKYAQYLVQHGTVASSSAHGQAEFGGSGQGSGESDDEGDAPAGSDGPDGGSGGAGGGSDGMAADGAGADDEQDNEVDSSIYDVEYLAQWQETFGTIDPRQVGVRGDHIATINERLPTLDANQLYNFLLTLAPDELESIDYEQVRWFTGDTALRRIQRELRFAPPGSIKREKLELIEAGLSG